MSDHQEKSSKAKVEALKSRAKTRPSVGQQLHLSKRHAKNQKTPRITTAAITRMGRRAGIYLFGVKSGIYDEARELIDYWLDKVVRDAVFMAQYARRKTIFKKDVMYSLDTHNRRLYDIKA